MSDKPMLKSLPCETCPCNQYIPGEPPDQLCEASPTGDFECDDLLASMRIAGYAREIAAMLAGESDIAVRFALASDIASALDNACYDVGAKLDKEAFMSACGLTENR